MLELKGTYNKDCKVFINDVEEEAMSLIYSILNTKEFNGVPIRIMPDCLTIDSEILTSNGFKLIRELSFDDKIANFNPTDKKVSFNKPISIINRPMRIGEKIYSFTNKRGFSLSVSENHRMALKNNMGEVASNVDGFLTKEHYFNADGLYEAIEKYTDNEIRLICWIVGDGNIHVTHNKTSDCYRIKFGFKKDRKIKRLISLLDEEKIVYHIVKKNNKTFITINKKFSEKYIEYVSLLKKLPNDFIFLSKRQCDIFFNEMIQVDGDYESFIKHGTYRISSKDIDNINIISAVASLNYGLSSIKHKKISTSHNDILYYINIINANKLNYSKGGIHNSKFVRTELTDYTDNVVCVETDTGFFIARQNGMTFISGNCHAGKGIVIGFTAPINQYVSPSHVGVDIGCTITTCITDTKINKDDFPLIEHRIKKLIPMGFNVNPKSIVDEKDFFKFIRKEYSKAKSSWPEMILDIDVSEKYITSLLKKINMDEGLFYKSIGTVGGGNHFIEIGNCNGNYAFTVHCGSRNFGNKVCKYWENIASSNQVDKKLLKEKIQKLKKTVTDKTTLPKLIDELIEQEKSKTCSNGYLSGDNMSGYITDMVIAQAYAKYNHKVICDKILSIFKSINNASIVEVVQSVHNYIDINGDHMIRKGAIRAYKDEKMVVPFNMRDGLAICVGKSNPDWNFSCSHGAGRKLSRSKAKSTISIDEFKDSMKDIYTTSVCANTLDESPMAYKDTDTIISLISETCDILYMVKPIINIKSTDEEKNYK